MGHKFALSPIAKGEDVIKYGECIGQTTAAIARGEHVHVHNVVSHRWRKEGA
jgi:altronate dehydratase